MFSVATYWPFQDGVAQVTGYLAEGLAAKGHEVIIYTSTGNQDLAGLAAEEKHNDVFIRRIRVYTQWPLVLKGLDRESTPERYYCAVKECCPDVLIVVCSQIWTLDWIIPYLDRLPCYKVFQSHGYSLLQKKYDIWDKVKKRNVLGAWAEYQKYRYYKNLYKVIGKFDLALYLFENNNSAEYAKEHGLTNGKILSNAIDDRFFDDEMQHIEKLPDKDLGLQYLYVANFNENKNQRMLLQAFAEANIGKSRLIFVGFSENEYLKMLREESGTLLRGKEHKKVDFKVHISREEVYDLYRESDVFVCASRSETASIVLFEAAATGMAIISTKVGLAEKLDGIVLVENKEELKNAIQQLYADHELRKENGKRLKACVESGNCRISDKVNWLEQELLELIKQETSAFCM